MPFAKSSRRIEPVTFAAVFVWLMAIAPSSLLRDPGTLWHIRVGERMLEAREVVRTDPFSVSSHGQPWVPVGWLSECLFALLHRLAGLDAVVLASVAALAWLYAKLAQRLAVGGLGTGAAAVVLTLVLAASSHHFLPRPHVATMLLFAWSFARLADFEAGRLGVRGLVALVPAVALWTNLHGGVAGGLATFALCGAGWTAAWMLGRESPSRSAKDFALLVLLGLACLVATLANPYGAELPKTWVTLLDSPVLQHLMVEHAPLSLSSGPGRLTAGLAALYGAMLLGVPLGRWRVTWLVPAVWFALTLSRVRNGPMFAIVAAVAIAEMYPEVRWRERLAARGSELLALRADTDRAEHARWTAAARVVPAALVAITLVLQVARVPVPVFGAGWSKLDPSWWPVELLPELQAFERSHPDGTGVFNEMLLGGFLIYHTPGLRVFLDDRCELYGDERLEQYRRAIHGETRWFEEWGRTYGFEIALSVTGSTFDDWLGQSKDWERVRTSDAATLYRRRS